jgi:phosphoenolpyruvate phosphomutase
VVVARVEALIAGHGMEEALKRGEEYRKAGADAVLIHSSKKNAAEILQFSKEWGNRLPLVIVPTKYYTTPTDAFREAGNIKIVIWANHLMRTAITTMQATARQIFQDQSLINVEEKVAPLAEVFRLQGEQELEKAEKAYLPTGGLVTRGIVLAAGRGLDELGELVKDKPKTMLPIGGKPILGHILDAYRSANVRDLVVVRGFAKESVNLPVVTYVDNDAWSTTGEAASLAAAKASLEGAACLVSYGDVMFKKNVLDELLEAEGDFVIAVDSLPVAEENKSRVADWVIASEPHSRKTLLGNVTLKEMARTPDAAGITGEWTGILKTSANGGKILGELLGKIEPAELAKLSMQDVLRRLVKDGHSVKVVYSRGGWLDVNTLNDVVKGSSFK